MEISLIRDLTENELDVVSGGGKRTASIVEAPPPQEPEIPLLPGVVVS